MGQSRLASLRIGLTPSEIWRDAFLYPGLGEWRLKRIVNFSVGTCEAGWRGLRMCGVWEERVSEEHGMYRWIDGQGEAPGAPGLEPRWTSSQK